MYEKIDKTQYTPMMRQYLTIKESYPDTLVFFRLGDFYEMFFNDALVASKELEIVLTGRDAGVKERVPMCGVPYHAVDQYIERLSDKGYKVAIVEQLEAPNGKNIVARDVVRIITPGTNFTEAYLDEKTNNYLATISKEPENYSLSYLDISTGETKTTLLPLKIESVYDELNKMGTKEVIVGPRFPKPYVDYMRNVLNLVVSIQLDQKLEDYLLNLVKGLPKQSIDSASRLLNYVIATQKRVLVHLKPFAFYQDKSFLKLDPNTIRNLELVQSLRGDKSRNNLFACLDKCATAMGSRHLKRSILFPFTKLEPILKRQQMIEDFSKDYLVSEEIRVLLREVYDLERIVGRISFGTVNPKDLIQLKRSLGVVPQIKKLIAEIKTKTLNHFNQTILAFSDLHKLLDEAINENAPFLLRDGGVIKQGYSEELDKVKYVSLHTQEILMNIEQREREKTGIKNLKIGFNKVFGYYLEVTKSNIPLVKEEFGYIRKQTTSNSERYITEELKELEALILRSNEHAIELEIKLFEEVRSFCKARSPELQQLADVLSELDLVLALMIIARNNLYVRPTFSQYSDIVVKKGRHPVVEQYSPEPFIPNDLLMYNDNQILLITGPNMSGKSTYMRQNALMVIMAQMGSYVPAESAELPIFDQIFTRIGSSDDIASGASTFMSEMLEVNYALQNATERSLIILDEVGRGTATFDGLALAQAIIEYIHEKIGAKTLFSTHYHELTNLEKNLARLNNVHVEAKEENGKIVFLHQVLKGATDKSYGIHVASLANLPKSLTLRAHDILQKMDANNHYDSGRLSLANYTEPVIVNALSPVEEGVLNELKELDVDDLRPLDALVLLSRLKERLK
jgi:DNA mismatch repair protein MutS